VNPAGARARRTARSEGGYFLNDYGKAMSYSGIMEQSGRGRIKPRVDMPEQTSEERVGNFFEVALGYTPVQAIREAMRCLQCKTPWCHEGCPLGIDIKGFVGRLQVGDFPGAYAIVAQSNSLPAVCGRLCHQEALCERACVLAKKGLPVAIGRLERFTADHHLELNHGPRTPKLRLHKPSPPVRVACLGSGPSSLAVAGYLASRGAEAAVLEHRPVLGGVLSSGIAEFRLPESVLRSEIEALKGRGVTFRTGWTGEAACTVRDLLAQGFDAVFIGVGSGLPARLGVPGEDLAGVYPANEFLACRNLGTAGGARRLAAAIRGRRVVVFGGGDTAVDGARAAIRLGAAETTLVYRRTRNEMRCRQEELSHAIEEGLAVSCLRAPLEFLDNGQKGLAGVRLQRMRLGGLDETGRRRAEACPGEICEVEADLAVVAVGARPDPVLLKTAPGLLLDGRGHVVIDPDTGETSIPNVFAGGLVVSGSAAVVPAMHHGRRAAREIALRFLGRNSKDRDSA